MQISDSTYLFTIASLHKLSIELATPNYVPTATQRLILEQALRLLDLELGFQAAKHPELISAFDEWLDFSG